MRTSASIHGPVDTADGLADTVADVLVIGGGGAGLAAAVEAARFGAQVVLLEKNRALGGSTAWSVGSISVSNSPHQRLLGIKDSPGEHFEDLELLAGPYRARDNRALRRILVEGTTDMLDWLQELGLVFIGPHPEPPHRYPRMHNVLPNSLAFPYQLGRRARALGVDIRTDIRALAFREADGHVSGVTAVDLSGRKRVFSARSGVVLASGDYSASADLKRALASEEVAALFAVNETATGDGHRMAVAIGAEIVNGDIVRGPVLRFMPPPANGLIQSLPPTNLIARIMRLAYEKLPKSLLRPFMMRFLTTALGPSPDLFASGVIMVDRQGRRFVDELSRPAAAVARQEGNAAYLLMDAVLERKFSAWPHFVSTAPGIAYAYMTDYRRTRRDIVHQASTLEGLAAKVGMPPHMLADTVRNYNLSSERAERPQILAPPFLMLGPVRSYVVFTDGGLRVTERLEVQRPDGTTIPGLYAAGSAGQGGLLLEGHGHHLSWAFISGRIAGRNAALNGRGARAAGLGPA